jgi:hypothetical protein
MNKVMKVVKELSLLVLQQEFDNNCSITIAIRKTQVNQVLYQLENIPGLTIKFTYVL